MAENGAFSRAKAPFSPRPELTVLDRNPPVCQILRLWSPAPSSRLRARESAGERHFSRTWARTDLCERCPPGGRWVSPILHWLIPPLAESRDVVVPLTVLSPGPGLAGTPSRGNGNEGLKRLSLFRGSGVCRQPVPPGLPVVGAQVAADGSRWQFPGQSPPPSRRARRNRPSVDLTPAPSISSRNHTSHRSHGPRV
jgi:hypothetical protein